VTGRCTGLPRRDWADAITLLTEDSCPAPEAKPACSASPQAWPTASPSIWPTHLPAWTPATPNWSPTRSDTPPDTDELIPILKVREWLNGHEYAKRAATAAGIGFTELDNGFAASDDPAGLQGLCHTLGPGTIAEFCQRWWTRLPLPLTDADRAAGY
jgi:hypothetical protein